MNLLKKVAMNSWIKLLKNTVYKMEFEFLAKKMRWIRAHFL